jgi:hypothetical protein
MNNRYQTIGRPQVNTNHYVVLLQTACSYIDTYFPPGLTKKLTIFCQP